MEKPIKVRLHIISPVHIGCDDVYEPTSFAIDEKKRKLIEFDTMDFIRNLSPRDKQEFAKICMEGSISSIVKLYNFISNKKPGGREIDISSGLITHYDKVKKLSTKNEREIGQELNKFSISRTAYNPHNNLPYIPGSSIKGALRTAYLSKVATDMGIKGREDRAKYLEIELLGGSFNTDPFRMVKPSDFLPVENVKTKIVYAVNKKKDISRFEAMGGNITQILEVVKEDAVFEGTVSVQRPEQRSEIKKPISAKELLTATHEFYKSIVNKEDDVTHNIDAGRIVIERIINKFKDKLCKSAFLLRIGRHSGAEAVTIEGNRHIKIIQGKDIQGRNKPPKFLDHATTIWFASESSKPTSNNGLVPFGWAVMEVIA